MIAFIRAKMGTRWLNTFVWIAIISMSGIFFLADIVKMFKQHGDYVLKVNSATLGQAEFEHKLRAEQERLAYMQQQYGEQVLNLMLAAQTGFSMDPIQNVLNNFMLSNLISQAGAKLKLQIAPATARQTLISKLPPALVDQASGKIDQKAVWQTFQQSVPELEQAVAQELQAGLVLDLVGGAAYVGQFEVEQDYASRHGQKKFAVISFPAQELSTKIAQQAVSDQVLLGFFKQQNDLTKRYWTVESRTGQLWELTEQDFGIKVSDTEVTSFYNKHKKQLYQEQPAEIKVRRIFLPRKEGQDIYALYTQAKELRDKLVSGQESFAKHQVKESTIKQTSEQATGVEKAAIALKTDGEISPVVELPGGVEIIQRVSRKPATFKPLASLKAQLTKELTLQKFRKIAEVTLRRMANSASGVQQFKKLAEKKGAKSQRLMGTIDDQDPKVRGLFAIKTPGQLSYSFDGDKLLVSGLIAIDKAHVKPFDQIKSTVLQDYRDEQVTQALQAKLNQVKQAYQAQKGPGGKAVSFDSLAQQFGGELYTTKELTRSQVYEDTGLRAKRIPLDVVWDLAQVDAVTTYVTRGNEFLIGETGISRADRSGYVIRLVDLKLPPTDAKTAEQKGAIAKTLRIQRNQQWQQAFIASLGKTAKIETNQTLLKTSHE